MWNVDGSGGIGRYLGRGRGVGVAVVEGEAHEFP
jgi:hypothetical protein